MSKFLAKILSLYARAYLWRYKPSIVAVTGNAGKTTTKEAIAAVLATKYRVRATGGNLNNELGTPLTIIGDFATEYYSTGGTLGFWLKVLAQAKLNFWFKRHDYPEILVLEYGADRPGDIKRLAKLFAPHVSVVTQVGEVPVHVEYFASAQHLAEEKMQIIKHLKPDDHAVLNYDDQSVLDMRSHTVAHVHTFGLAAGAQLRADDIRVRTDGQTPLGIAFDITNGDSMPVAINGTLGRGIAAASAAAVTVGKIYGVGLADAVQALCALRPPAGRLRILKGIKDTVIIDDTYNASPAAMHLALDTVKELKAVRKVLVLGDMLELGEHAIQAHQAAGDMAGDIADVLVCVGERAKFIADSAANQMAKESILTFHESRDAIDAVQALLRPGDLVLVKGSQGKRMERIVKEIMAEPDRAGELLVRQSATWLAK
jgi:UDP-N-acetylmuramyl pentapeptide synthase